MLLGPASSVVIFHGFPKVLIVSKPHARSGHASGPLMPARLTSVQFSPCVTGVNSDKGIFEVIGSQVCVIVHLSCYVLRFRVQGYVPVRYVMPLVYHIPKP